MHHEAENGCVIAAGADTGVGFGSCSPPLKQKEPELWQAPYAEFYPGVQPDDERASY